VADRVRCVDEKQFCHRLSSVLADFDAGRCDVCPALPGLEISYSQLDALRHRLVTDPAAP
jgi:hypothetical protein